MEILITILIFLLPLGVLTRFQIFPNVFIYLNDVFAAVSFVVFLAFILTKKYKINDRKILIPLLGFIAVGLCSLLINSKMCNFGILAGSPCGIP